MQLNRYLAICGVASRRKACGFILQGRVAVNREVVRNLGVMVDSANDSVCVDGRKVEMPRTSRTILLNKPAGVITSSTDGRGRKTVVDLVDAKERIFPVGRLDYDTEGVLLLTDDGQLAYRLTHPKFEVEKVYEAWVEGDVGEKDLHRLKTGVEIDPDVIVSGEAKILEKKGERTRVEICVHEGKKRQIKRMMKMIGHPVLSLKRTFFAGLTVRGLKGGEWRDLKPEEIRKLYKMTGLESAK